MTSAPIWKPKGLELTIIPPPPAFAMQQVDEDETTTRYRVHTREDHHEHPDQT